MSTGNSSWFESNHSSKSSANELAMSWVEKAFPLTFESAGPSKKPGFDFKVNKRSKVDHTVIPEDVTDTGSK
jgi:hypothetical protein